jgi:hypothetical protein
MWILINRLLCILQPLEELHRTHAPAAKSISLNYNSIPPQLTIVQAVRSGNLLLASVCGMVLLANVLAIAFAGLLFQDILPLSRPASFLPPFAATFVSINGSSGPPRNEKPTISAANYSGAYQGGTGEDQFLVAESNYTRNTSLPSWADKDAMYLPFFGHGFSDQTERHKYQARTKYFSAEPNCKPLVFNDDYHLQLLTNATSDDGEIFLRTRAMRFDIQIPDKHAKNVTCYPPVPESFGAGLGLRSQMDVLKACRLGKLSAELVTTLTALLPNATQHEHDTCSSVVVLGWMRTTNQHCIPADVWSPSQESPTDLEQANAHNTFLLSCRPRLEVGDASVVVDSDGLLQEKAMDVVPEPDQNPQTLDKYSTNGVSNLIAQSNLFLFRLLESTYHNDSFASEYIHYFMNRAAGNLRLTNPSEPLPRFEDVEQPMRMAYKRHFAIWLGVNKELLFLPSSDAAANVTGTIITLEERLLFNTPLFIVSEVILSIYVIMSMVMYLRCPGRYLARMPTSIAAVIALFAASAAVKDLQGTSNMTSRERDKYLNDTGCIYGYGSYVGGDGSVHVGIEKVPFVRKMKETRFEHSRADREMRQRTARVGRKGNVGVRYKPLEGTDCP